MVKCGDKILPHCLEARNVDEINDAILYKMENLLDTLKVRSDRKYLYFMALLAIVT